MRLNKFLANAGVASRRKSEELISSGRIKVNGELVTDVGFKVDEVHDVICFDDREVRLEDEKKVYILINKPEGYITTAKDQFGRPGVLDLVPGISERIYPVGRLDYETSGLLLLTNDGDLTFRMTHPKHEFEKVYIASVRGIPSENELSRFRSGLEIDDYVTSKAEISVLKTDKVKNYAVCRVSIHEGHNRQVRKMFEAINHPVMNLKRVKLGRISLGDLQPGNFRHLTESELEYLRGI